jgi:hypothetical protein
LLRPLAAYIVPIGVVVMVVAGSAWWVRAALMVLGIVATKKLGQLNNKTNPTSSSAGAAVSDPQPS